VQVEAPQVLPVLTFLDDRGHGAGVGAVGRRSQTNTVIVSRPGGAGCLGLGKSKCIIALQHRY